MTKEQFFKKHKINESHNEWESIDDWMSVEIYRVMHGGNLPSEEDLSLKYISDFLDKFKDFKWVTSNILSRPDGGSLYLTAKRMAYKFCDKILEECHPKDQKQ